MEYRQLGRSGIAVSAFGLGAMTFGGQTGEEDAFRQLDIAHDAGVTLIDTAENYPTPISAQSQGRSEEIVGRWARSRRLRDGIVLATKAAGPGNAAGDMRHIRGDGRRLDHANLSEAIENSLRRLGTDHIDLYQVHWPERKVTTLGRSRYSLIADEPEQVAIEETLAALGALVDAGKVRAIGICNESPWGMMRYLAASVQAPMPRIAAIQNGYSLLDRSFELGLAEIAIREQVGLIAYSPLAAGTLTGKYGKDPAPIPGSRSSQSPAFLSRLSERKLKAIEAYGDLARAQGLDPAQMALAFVRRQPFVTSVLVAASSVDQLERNLGARDLSLPHEVVQAINAIHDSDPNPR